ncbi:alpha/beta hydrolase [Carnobacterium funditum]|uniref:alpha/beta hydrolase n=1 Tax=Carnobacterium funditum TaxID=2752 RepID=UPI000555ED02|nr:alpha/beta hydrolase [Carnobacterium funditum]
MNNKKKIAIWTTLALLLLFVIGSIMLKNFTYQPSPSALQAATNQASYTVEKTTDLVYFKPKEPAIPISIIFYQGALVNQKSYSIWASKLATEGYPVYLIHHAFNLAVTSKDKAQTIINEYAIGDYVIGGHSLGGVMASRFAHDKQMNPSTESGLLKGVFFLASYPDPKGSLKNSLLPILSVTGSNDGVLNQKSYIDGKKFLPKNTLYLSIKDGNHAGFGSYGHQKGDNPATISNEEQQKQLSLILSSWLDTIKK